MLSSLLSLVSVAQASDLALYWGQASAGSESSLADYCTNSPGDIYIISFVNSFGSGNQIHMDIRGYNTFFPGTGLLDASSLGSEIETCQKLGKKVLVSLGGSTGQYGFNSASDAENVAEQLWNYFGGGQSSTRPFGSAKIDGFDLNSENKQDSAIYVPFVNKLRQLYSTDSSKSYYVAASPQCPYPDASVGDAIAQTDIDYLFIQFYNNYCSLTGNSFNFDTWQNFASNTSPNKNVKLYVGLAGSPTAAGSGYATLDQVRAKFPQLEKSSNFAGFMVWDASQANDNVVNGESFAQGLAKLGAPAAPSTTSTSSSTAAATTAAGSTTESTGVATGTSSTNSAAGPSSTAPAAGSHSSNGDSAAATPTSAPNAPGASGAPAVPVTSQAPYPQHTSVITSNGVLIFYETVKTTYYTTIHECCTQL